MENRIRNLNIILIVFFLLLTISIFVISCSSVRTSSITSPKFNLIKPVRPTLNEIEDDVQIPTSILNNTVLLIGYIEELETYSEGWENYYQQLTEYYNGNN